MHREAPHLEDRDNGGVKGTVVWIHVAPIKALHVEERRSVVLGPHGVEDDRRFCIVDDEGRMTNAKRVPAFVSVRPHLLDGELALDLPDGRTVRGAVELAALVRVHIYGREVAAREVAGPFGDALSALAGRPLRLVRFDEAGQGVDRAQRGGAASLLSVASLDALAEAASADGAVDPRRFRMLFGVAGVPAHAEDGWVDREVRIGEAVLVPLGNIGRCAVTTLDPDAAVSDLDTLAALARYRGGVATTERLPFGVWARIERGGRVSVGDEVTV